MSSVLLANNQSSKTSQCFSLEGPTSAQVTHLFGLVFLIQSQGGHFTKHLGTQPFTPKLYLQMDVTMQHTSASHGRKHFSANKTFK